MVKTILLFLLSFQCTMVFGQNKDSIAPRNIGISYFGELALRPGFEIDYGILLSSKKVSKEERKIIVQRQISLRPALAYYYYTHNSNNFSLATKLNCQFRFTKEVTEKYFNLEPFIKIGYLRKSYIGEIFQTTSQGIQPIKTAGTNSFTLGGGVDFGGYVTKRFDWLFGGDYFAAITEDQLVLHRFVLKLGTRIKLY